MSTALTQLPLAFYLKEGVTFDNFYVARNLEIVEKLKQTAIGHGERMIYLCGSCNQGISHLLKASCHDAQQHHLSSVYLPLRELYKSHTPDILTGLESCALVCIDDLHVIAGCREWEEAIFHLYNRIHEKAGSLIVSGRDLPKMIQLQLADLVSRLSWGIVFQLHALTDEEKLMVLTQSAERRGIHLSEEVGQYVMRHCPRHMGTLLAALDALDKASLAAQRRLTIPFVKEVLQM
ncbi:MAG TPA: DnaA regulatory inactivator Hda [Gammaproteobacteria bacterium]|jgi:DnaA family protein|nr:DnaA regulatory inactivator Hda [Gammaproteobacteria bacterium]